VRDPQAIYAIGAHKLDDVLDWCADLGVPAVTLWVFSTDNLDRPIEQVSGILAAIEAKVRTLTHHPKIHHRRVRVQAIGKLELLPPSLIAAIRAAHDATASYEGITLTIAVAYGGRDEIVDAVRGLLAEQAERGLTVGDAIGEITREGIARHLYTAGSPDPDLIVRTSGEIRLSAQKVLRIGGDGTQGLRCRLTIANAGATGCNATPRRWRPSETIPGCRNGLIKQSNAKLAGCRWCP
jgi:short-chain Z-isoprenyl diphosphate synthase